MEETFGEALHRRRGSLSLRDVAHLANCSRGHVGDLVTGRRKPTPQIAAALDKALRANGELIAFTAPPGTPQTKRTIRDPGTVPRNVTIRQASREAGERSSSDATAIASFRAADRQLGGGHLYRSVLRYLHHNIAPRLFGSEEDDEPQQTFLAAASLTELAGWMAHDSGSDAHANRHFQKALPLARSGNDPALGANIMASMSHLALQRGRLSEAASLAQAGRKNANLGPKVPALSSRLYAMEARALAKRGEAEATRRVLDAAHEELRSAPVPAVSEWTSSFDSAALASEAALALQDLGKLSAAAAEAERAVSLRPGDRARSRVFGQISLALIRVQQGELEAACTVGNELLGACHTLGSIRATNQLNNLAIALNPYRQQSSVSDFLECLLAVNEQRAVLFADIGASPTMEGSYT